MTFGIFEEVERLIEYIPIDCDTFQIDGRLAKDTSIDSKFYFEDIDGIATRLGIIEVVQVEAEKMKVEGRFKTVVSFRDIVRLLNKFLKDARVEEVIQKQRYTCSTCISTLFAFFHLRGKLFALLGACITYFCTYIADLFCIFTSS